MYDIGCAVESCWLQVLRFKASSNFFKAIDYIRGSQPMATRPKWATRNSSWAKKVI